LFGSCKAEAPERALFSPIPISTAESASMRIQPLFAISVLTVGLAGCGGGDIKLVPSTSVNNSNNSTTNNPPPTNNPTPTTNPCASYLNTAGQTIQGAYDGTNCTYSRSFVDAGNNLMVDMTLTDLPNNGAHIFQGSLFVGKSYTSNAELQAANIREGGDGPQLTIDAGATVAFATSAQFMVINRGSQIFAVGTADAPITLTSLSDVQGTVQPLDVQQWGGLVINGFGVTNKCAYTGAITYNADGTVASESGLALAGECHVESEGSAGLDENHYGGGNNNDSSGRLEYVVVKHTGATVGNGDELNGITFGAVGRNTIVRNVETYSVYDDGLEFFGGAVNVDNYLALYVRDDSLDFDEGYIGRINNALIVQQETDGANCIEADGIGDYASLTDVQRQAVIDAGINSRPVINHLTCIFSANPNNDAEGTHDPGAGVRFREGIFPTLSNSLVVSSFKASHLDASAPATASDNYCLRIDDRSQQAAVQGSLKLQQVIFACAERTNSSTPWTFDGTTTTQGFATAQGNQFATVPVNTAVRPTAAAASGLQLLEGTVPVYSIAWNASQVDSAAPVATTAPTDSSGYLGALSTGATDWTATWTYGLHNGRRAIPLWFE
jgi:hypothetical protein